MHTTRPAVGEVENFPRSSPAAQSMFGDGMNIRAIVPIETGLRSFRSKRPRLVRVDWVELGASLSAALLILFTRGPLLRSLFEWPPFRVLKK